MPPHLMDMPKAIIPVLILAVLLTTLAHGVMIYIDKFYNLTQWGIDGEGGAAVAVPNAQELWARQLVFYINNTGVDEFEYMNTWTWMIQNSTWWVIAKPRAQYSPFIDVLFTLRAGEEPVVEKWIPAGEGVFEPGGHLKPINVQTFNATPGGGKVYLVWMTTWATPEIRVYDVSPGNLRRLWWRFVDICDWPKYVWVNAFPNGTLKITFVNATPFLGFNFSEPICGNKAVNVTYTIQLGGDLWVWVSPDYPTTIIAGATDPWYFKGYLEHNLQHYSALQYVMSWFYPDHSGVLSFFPCGNYPLSFYQCVRYSPPKALELGVYVGNDTLMVPPLVYPFYAGVGAEGRVVNFTYYAGATTVNRTECFYPSSSNPYICPFGRPAKPLWDLRGKTAEICDVDAGQCQAVPAGTLFWPPPGYTANASKTPLGYVAVGHVYIHKPFYYIRVEMPNGTAVFKTPWGAVFNYTPPDVYEEDTAYVNATPIALKVWGNATVRPNYTVLYRVRVETPLGEVVAWAPSGSLWRYQGADVTFDNGTWVVVYPVEVVVDKPTALAANYTVYYNVTVVTPLGTRWEWLERGSRFEYSADMVLNNKTRIVVHPIQIAVDKPMTLVANYTVYYLVEVEAPNGTLRLWAERGSRFEYGPEPWDFGNGTRLAGVRPCSLVVEAPSSCALSYEKRQYYVRVEMLNGAYVGWADEGSTWGSEVAVDNVFYKPIPVVVRGPGDYAVRYVAVFQGVARDVLGVPNPLAEISLCNATARPGLDGRFNVSAEADGLCRAEVKASPVSPYTAAAVAIPSATALALRRRRPRK